MFIKLNGSQVFKNGHESEIAPEVQGNVKVTQGQEKKII